MYIGIGTVVLRRRMRRTGRERGGGRWRRRCKCKLGRLDDINTVTIAVTI